MQRYPKLHILHLKHVAYVTAGEKKDFIFPLSI